MHCFINDLFKRDDCLIAYCLLTYNNQMTVNNGKEN